MTIKVCAFILLFIIKLRFPRSQSFATIIRRRYGNDLLKKTRLFEKTLFRKRKIQLDISFWILVDLIMWFRSFSVFGWQIATYRTLWLSAPSKFASSMRKFVTNLLKCVLLVGNLISSVINLKILCPFSILHICLQLFLQLWIKRSSIMVRLIKENLQCFWLLSPSPFLIRTKLFLISPIIPCHQLRSHYLPKDSISRWSLENWTIHLTWLISNCFSGTLPNRPSPWQS